MIDIDPYLQNAEAYDEWFEKNRLVYDAELRAISSLFTPTGYPGIEVGVGTGRFARPLGIKIGVEPSPSMGGIALRRGIMVVGGVAESLPFRDSAAGYVVMVTTICFVNDIFKTLQESFRILLKGGIIIIGMLDRNSPMGQIYVKHKGDHLFYKRATFYSVDEILNILKQTGFRDFDFRQTIFQETSRITKEEIVKTGYGEGLFVVVRGKKP